MEKQSCKYENHLITPNGIFCLLHEDYDKPTIHYTKKRPSSAEVLGVWSRVLAIQRCCLVYPVVDLYC